MNRHVPCEPRYALDKSVFVLVLSRNFTTYCTRTCNTARVWSIPGSTEVPINKYATVIAFVVCYQYVSRTDVAMKKAQEVGLFVSYKRYVSD
jgi:hypothetical protein